MKPENTDLTIVANESKEKIESLVDAFETLRLFCEGHHKGLQEFLRVQSDDGIKRANSVNMILSVTDILIHYKDIVDDFNIELGNKIFEYFVETLQGPCIENQVEICKTKLLETVEDLLIHLTRTKRKNDKDHTQNDRGTMSEYSKSEIVKNIINFMLSIVEGSHDPFILTKVSIHVNQDMFLKRLRFIYKLFRDDINKHLIGAFDLIKLPMSLKSGLLGSKSKHKSFSESLSKSLEPNSVNQEYKVLIDNKRNYNPIIMEGIYIWILIQTISHLDSNFEKRFHELVREMESNNRT